MTFNQDQKHIYNLLLTDNHDLAKELDLGQGLGMFDYFTKELEWLLKYTELSLKDLFMETELDLSWAELRSLPNGLRYLKNLKKLKATHNHITHITEIFDLINLEWVSLYNNLIYDVPKEIWRLKNLKHLNLSKNVIEVLPSSVGELVLMKEFYVDKNQLKVLPDSICGLMELEVLSVHDNLLKELPVAMSEMKIKDITFHGNRFSDYDGLYKILEGLGLPDIIARKIKNL